jgi:hypothetical protein
MNEISKRSMAKAKSAILFGMLILFLIGICYFTTSSKSSKIICCIFALIVVVCTIRNYITYRVYRKMDKMEIIGRG